MPAPSNRPQATWRQLTASVAISALVLSGCTTTGSQSRTNLFPQGGATSSTTKSAGGASSTATTQPLTSAELDMRQESEVFNETVAGGAITGAVVGALLGGLIAAVGGGRGGDIGRGMAIGAAAGGIMGGADGYLTAKANQNGNNRVRMLNSMTRDIAADNARLAKLVATSQEVLKDDEARLAKLNQDYEQNTISLKSAQEEKAKIEANRDVVAKTLANVKDRRDKYQQAAAKVGTSPDLDKQINELNQQIAQLEQSLGAMNSALKVSKV